MAGVASHSMLPAGVYDQERQEYLEDGPEELQRLWSKFAETRDAATSATHVRALHEAQQSIHPFQASIQGSDFRSAFCFLVTDALDGYLEEPSSAALEELAAAAAFAKPVTDWHAGQEAVEVTAGLLQLLRRDTQRMCAAAAARASSDCAAWDARLAHEIQPFAERHMGYFVHRLLPFASNSLGTAALEKFVSALSAARGLCAKDAWDNVALSAATCLKAVFEVHVSYLRHNSGCLRALAPLLDLGSLLPLHLHAALCASIARCAELSAEAAAAGAALKEESTGHYFAASPLKGFTEPWLQGQLSHLLGALAPVLASRAMGSAATTAGVSEQVWRAAQGQAFKAARQADYQELAELLALMSKLAAKQAEQKGAWPPRQQPLRLLEQQAAVQAPGPLAPHNRLPQDPAAMVPPRPRLQPEQHPAGAAAAAVAPLNHQGQQQQEQQQQQQEQEQELSLADMTRVFAQMKMQQEQMERQMQVQQEQLEQERALRRQLEAQAQVQQEAEQRQREHERLAQEEQHAEREAAAAAAAAVAADAEEQRLQPAEAAAAAREAAGARAAHEQAPAAGRAAVVPGRPTPLLPSDPRMDLSTADPAEIAPFRFLTSGEAHKEPLAYLSAVLAGQAYVPDSHGGQRTAGAAGAAGSAPTFKQDPHLRAVGGVVREDGVVQLAKQLGGGSAEGGCSELPRHLLGMVGASLGGTGGGDGSAAAGGVAAHRPFSCFRMQPSRLGANWQNHVSLMQHVMEAPRVTAAKFAALRERYQLAFAPGRTGPAFSTMQSALRDPAVGLQWVWAEVRVCADGSIDFNALSWQALEG